MSSGSHRGHHRAKALLFMTVYMRAKETIYITQKELLGGAEKKMDFYSFSRPDIDFSITGGKQRNDKS